jgi:hypothetical protein
MKWTSLAGAMTLAIATMSANAAPAKSTVEISADVLRPHQLRKPAARLGATLELAPAAVAAAAPTVDDVGDAESFGRNVTYLGLAQTLSVLITDDCTGSDPAVEHCIVANAPPAITNFNEADLATVNLPAKATKSLVCFTLTPFINLAWANTSATPATARFNAAAAITIDNEILDDPALIDPNTGLPFGGSLAVSLSTWTDSHSIQPGAFENKSFQQSRGCIAGVIGKRALVETYGLTETQATQFFKKPMTLHFGARGAVAMSQFTNYFYGIRLYGD